MNWVQIALGVLTAAVTLVAVALVARAAARIVRIIRLGQSDGTRIGPFGPRIRTTLVETLGHTPRRRPA